MFDLQCMSYTGEDGKIVDFRLKDRLLRKWKDLAYALKFPAYVIDTMKKEDDPLDQLLMKWLQGDNKTEDLGQLHGERLLQLCVIPTFRERSTSWRNILFKMIQFLQQLHRLVS